MTIANAPNAAFNNFPPHTESWEGQSINLVSTPDGTGNVWPTATFTYMLVYTDQTQTGARGAALKAFLLWIMTEEAQSVAIDVGLVPLDREVAKSNTDAIEANIRVEDEDLVTAYLSMEPTIIETEYRGRNTTSASGRLRPPAVFALLSMFVSAVRASIDDCIGGFTSCVDGVRETVSLAIYGTTSWPQVRLALCWVLFGLVKKCF